MKIEIGKNVKIVIFCSLILTLFIAFIFVPKDCDICKPCECKEDCKTEILFANFTLIMLNDCIRDLGICYNLTEEEIEKALIE